ncbi:hypothetical protein BV22DRAFT_1131056 [Leucogyrophana mollusca]|uniref:Uncharacterized protein n=2 Tax=Leucogyrophana mollusca TaxID=85980 RepID=A0ACB8AXT1_9AGAM|nr:hypothetical protein BV22DRAFT_1135127 [Leucogyrophana mollusca]KAH7922867.1 hypothetical protein BV22DRAFT_1131056 [Leucogyrophana mollusca]
MSQPQSQTVPTRSSSRRDTAQPLFAQLRARSDLIANSNQQSIVKSAISAKKFLYEKGFHIPAAGITIETLSTALLEFSTTAPNLSALHVDTIRAIAILLEEACLERSTSHIINALKAQMEGPLALLGEQTEKLEAMIERSKKSAETMTRVTEEVSTLLDNSTELLESAVVSAVTHIDEQADVNSQGPQINTPACSRSVKPKPDKYW